MKKCNTDKFNTDFLTILHANFDRTKLKPIFLFNRVSQTWAYFTVLQVLRQN